MACDNTDVHPAHSYTHLMTTRHCPGIEKPEHFCGDRKAHKRHENRTHYCPGISRRQIQAEAQQLRLELRQYGLVVEPRLLVRERLTFLRVLQAFENVTAKSAFASPIEMMLPLSDDPIPERPKRRSNLGYGSTPPNRTSRRTDA